MTTDPTKLVDSEGEELSLNKVDKALKSIGISLQDTNGQFRNFDDVILELASKWDTLDTNAQRYIATVMAGNRQQSRFLAMVGNYERLAELTEEAANSEDAALIQQLKTMDSLQAKMNQLKVTFQEFYTSTGVEDLIKWTVDGITNIISRLNDMPKVFGKLPVAAITTVARIINAIKSAGQLLGPQIVKWFTTIKTNVSPIGLDIGREIGENIAQGIKEKTQVIENAIKGAADDEVPTKPTEDPTDADSVSKWWKKLSRKQKITSVFDIAGSLTTAIGTFLPDDWGKGVVEDAGAALAGFGSTVSGVARMFANPLDVSGWISAITGVIQTIEGLEENVAEKVKRLKQNIEESTNESLLKKNELTTLTDYKKKYEELAKTQYDSVEAKQDFLNLNNEIAANYPELLSRMDNEGNYLVDLNEKYSTLIKNKQKDYALSLRQKQLDEIAAYSDKDIVFENLGGNPANWDTPIWQSEVTGGSAIERIYSFFDKEGFWTQDSYQNLFNVLNQELLDSAGWINQNDAGRLLAEDYGINGYNKLLSRVDKRWYEDSEIFDISQEEILHAITQSLLYGTVTDEASPLYGQSIVKREYSKDVMTRAAAGEIQTSDYLNERIEQQLIPELIQAQLSFLEIDLSQIEYDNLLENIIKDFNIQKGDKSAVEFYDIFSSNVLFKEGFFEDYLNLIPEEIKKANDDIKDIYSNLERFSSQDLMNSLIEAGASNEIIEIITNKWLQDTLSAKERFVQGLAQLRVENEDDNIQNNIAAATLGANVAPELLDSILKQYQQAYEKIQNNPYETLTNLYNQILNLGPEAEQIVANADIFSLTGYIDMLKQLSDLGIDTDNILPTAEEWFEEISINLITEYNTFGQTLSEKIKSIGEMLEKATSGMDLEEALTFAQTLRISINDLVLKDGQFFYDNLEAIKSHYLQQYDNLKVQLETETAKQIEIISSYKGTLTVLTMADNFEEQLKRLPEEVQSVFNTYLEDWQNLSLEDKATYHNNYAEYIIEQLNNLQAENETTLNNYATDQAVRLGILNGLIYESLSLLGLTAEDVDKVVAAIQSGNIANIENESWFSDIQSYIGVINSSIGNTISDTWELITESISSGKFINVEEGSSQDKLLSKIASTTGSFIRDLQNGTYEIIEENLNEKTIKAALSAEAGNLTTVEYNSLYTSLFSAYEARGGSETAKQEGIATLIENADKLERETIAEIATNLGETATEIENKLTRNSDGTFSASTEQIDDIITEYEIAVDAELKDQLQERFNDIISMVSNGISGSASFQEIEIIQNYLNDAGLDIELKTFKTAEGLKYTEESVYSIYHALSQINTVAAQSLLEGISEQMEEWEGHSIDVATAYGKIRDIKKDIEKYNKSGDTARLNLAKQELAVWEQITLEKAKDEDNFDFMNQDLGDLNNPITFYESSAKAFETLGEASSSGYMGVEEYVNMLRFMGNMLDEESQRMALGGRNAAEAIRLGLSALKGVDGELKVNLSGLDFGITGLTEGMEGGIEEMAKSQIAWIDAQIAMLRGLTMLDTVDKLDDPSDQNVVLDYMDSFIGDFKVYVDELNKEVDLTELFKIKKWSPEQIVTFFNDILAIIESNDPATAREKIANYIKEAFNIKPEDLKIGESDNEELRKVIADGFAEKLNIENWEEDLGQNKTQEVVDGLAKMLGIDENNSLLKLLQAKIKEAGGSLSLNEIIEWFAANGVFTVGEDGKLILDMEATIEMRKNKSESEQNGVREHSLLDTDTPNYTTGENVVVTETTITSDVAKVNAGEIQFTTDKEEETPIPDEIDEAASSLNSDLSPAIEGAGQEAQEASQPVSFFGNLISTVKDKAKSAASSVRSFSYAVANTSSLQTKYNVLAKIVEQLNKLPTTQRYVGEASASGNVNIPSSNLGSSSSPPRNGEPDPNDYSTEDDYKEALRKWRESQGLVKGNALAAGTLMGELGPELVVSGGRYYVVGQNGAEFVNLPSDAIVFNHLQTKRLLESGHINSTGDPVTNERNAVAWATGNVNGGPAMASASDVIAQLLELRAFWQGILEMSAQDFAKAGGAGKGGGGGGEDNKAYIADLERWYNLLRQIVNLEQKITLEQAKRQNMTNGYDYVDSLEDELDYLNRQIKAQRELADLQKKYYDERRQDLLNSDYARYFTYTSDGLMQYMDVEGRDDLGYAALAKLYELDESGVAKYNASQQLEMIRAGGFDVDKYLSKNAEGTVLETNEDKVQYFFENIKAIQEELDGLYDEYNERSVAIEELIAAQTAIQQEYIDNQLSLEQQVYTAIVDREQAAIDAAQDEIDAIQEASDNFINGLNDTLKREKDMYQTNNEQAETERLQRQLAILQRSGGSASEIRALEEQLESRYQDAYFDSMQDEIDAIQAASENQIEKLQEQVDIAVEALEYQKANGLLWNEVYEIMNNWDANAITQFVMEFTKAFKEQSALQNQEQAKETLMSAEKWDAAAERQKQTEMWDQYFRQAMEQYGQTAATNAYSSAKAAYDKAYQATEGTVEQKHAAGMAAAKIEFEKSKAEIDRVTSGVSNGGNSSGETYPYGKVSEISRKETNVLTHEGPAIATIKYALKKLGYYKGEINEKYGTEVYNALVAFQKANKINADGIVGEETKKAFKLKGYSLGGLVDYTGLAMVHGTPQKPESYLNAEQTKELRNLLDEARALNSVSHSISNLNRLRQVWQTELFNQISSKEQSHQDAGDLIFEDVDINITSGVINNQAEAAQLGRTMWNEFINVAKKTGNLTLSRR